MDMIYPQSRKKPSAVIAFGYDDEQKRLVVRFKGGGEYAYLDTPRAAFDGMQASEDPMAYVNSAIKGKFKFERLGVKQPEQQQAA